MQGVMFDEMQMWQRIARFAGWSEWDVGPQEFTGSGKSGLGGIKLKSNFGGIKL